MIHKDSINSSAKGVKANEVGPLGINTKSSTPPYENPRSIRYELLSEARKIFVGAGKEAELEYPQNYHRTAKCIYSRFGEKVGVNKSFEFSRAFYTGVSQCGSVFTCPVCSAKIQERRRIEISKAFDFAYDTLENKKMIMVTFTFPHQKTDDLKDLVIKMRKAFVKLRAGNPWIKIKDRAGFEGLIRSLEITHSENNGFHPHTHEGWIVSQHVNVEDLQEKIVNRWFNMCEKVGLVSSDYSKKEHFLQHAVQIVDWCSNSEYFAKMDDSKHWGIDRELAKSSSKQAKGKGIHPFEFLSRSAAGNKRAKYLFLEYANAVKGFRQILWSAGLKQRVGVNELTDEEIAQQEEDKAEILGKLNKSEWNTIVKGNYQNFVLDLAESSGFEGVQFWLSSLGSPLAKDDKSKEVPNQFSFERKKITATIKKRAEQLQTAQFLQVKSIVSDRQDFEKHHANIRRSVRTRSLQYFDELNSNLSLSLLKY